MEGNSVDGGAGDDTLFGGDGHETFAYWNASGDYGHDFVDGGGGINMLQFGSVSAVRVDFRDGMATGSGPAGAWSVDFRNIDMVSGGDQNDVFIGAQASYTGYGEEGNDRMLGSASRDIMYGNEGNDTLRGGGGDDYIQGDSGNDLLEGGAGNDELTGLSGSDIQRGGAGNDKLDWSPDDVLVDGGSETDTLKARGWPELDLTAVPNDKIVDIEVIDLPHSPSQPRASVLTLARSDILDISSSTNTLKVLGDADDSVNIVGSFRDQGVSGGFHRYKVGTATLLVDVDITDVS